MPALSFQEEWIDKLLSGTKQQTTRPQTDRIKVGDIEHLYNQQRRRIADKPLRRLTESGERCMSGRMGAPYSYPRNPHVWGVPGYYAHFLGKVEITEVYDIIPCEMFGVELNKWAMADGFHGFHPWGSITGNDIQHDIGANMWFIDLYGDDWMHETWTVIRWNGWLERYFEPEVI